MLYCGDCNKREAKVINSNDIPENVSNANAARLVRCNICAGGRKRQKYGRTPNFQSLEFHPEIVKAALIVKSEYEAMKAQRAAVEAANYRLKSIEYAQREWNAESFTYEVSDKKVETYNGRTEGFVVAREGVENGRHSSSAEAHKSRDESVVYPYRVRTSVSSHLTANEARAVADALIRAANLVDAKNAAIRPTE